LDQLRKLRIDANAMLHLLPLVVALGANHALAAYFV
jgi:hypothetical protein